MKSISFLILAAWMLASCNVDSADKAYQLSDRIQLPTPTTEGDAQNCEFFVNSLGTERFHYTGGGYDELFVTAYLSVDVDSLVHAQRGKILQVGMRMNGLDDITSRTEFEPGYYKLTQSLWERGYHPSDYDLKYFAFFIDIQRRNGEIARLWLKNGDWDFTWPDVFQNYPKYVLNRGPSQYEYVLDPSPIYNQKNVCRTT